jgi:hypothetical protein
MPRPRKAASPPRPPEYGAINVLLSLTRTSIAQLDALVEVKARQTGLSPSRLRSQVVRDLIADGHQRAGLSGLPLTPADRPGKRPPAGSAR